MDFQPGECHFSFACDNQKPVATSTWGYTTFQNIREDADSDLPQVYEGSAACALSEAVEAEPETSDRKTADPYDESDNDDEEDDLGVPTVAQLTTVTQVFGQTDIRLTSQVRDQDRHKEIQSYGSFSTCNQVPKSSTSSIENEVKPGLTTSHIPTAPLEAPAQSGELQVLQTILAAVIEERDSARSRCEAQQKIIRDLSLVVDAKHNQSTHSHQNQKPGPRKPILPQAFSRKKRNTRQESFKEGWLMGGCPVLAGAEAAWSSRGSTEDALREVEKILSRSGEVQSQAEDRRVVKELIEAKLLQAAILRSLADCKQSLDLCEEALELCYLHNIPSLARKGQFHRGLSFIYSGKYAEARFCLMLAQGLEGHAEQLAVNQELADRKRRENVSETGPHHFLDEGFWRIPLGFYDV